MTAIAPDASGTPDSITADDLIEPAIELVANWLDRAEELEDRADRASMKQLGELVVDDEGVRFVMQFVDRVARPDDPSVAASQLKALVAHGNAPAFLGPIDKLMLTVGAQIAPLAPKVVMGLAARRMRQIVGPLVAPSGRGALEEHLDGQREAGYQANVNLLGEAVLGETEANARLERLKALLTLPEIDYVSVKITAVASQINHWAHEESLRRLTDRLAELVDVAAACPTETFVNFDMEEYHDLRLTIEAFKSVLGSPSRAHLDAGIVIQAYLPDSFAVMTELVGWANKRHSASGGTIKIRVVKGANLALEKVEAAMHGWEQAPYGSKLESDAGYRAAMDWLLDPDNLTGVRVGVASHNLFDVAWAKLVADQRGVSDRIQFEMLQGMAPGQAKAVNADVPAGSAPTLLYTPAVAEDDFDVAIGYLFRRLEENASVENYLRHVFDLAPGSAAFDEQAQFFRDGAALRHTVSHEPRRQQNRSMPPEVVPAGMPFVNEPDTDPSLRSNRAWIEETLQRSPESVTTPIIEDAEQVRAEFEVATRAQREWAARSAKERRDILFRVAHEMARRRGEIIATMMHEAHKTIAQGDVEVSEAIDFARWYGDRAIDLGSMHGATFEPLGVISVIPPWNFPFAIPAGGVLACLAAGNGVVFKPAPQTPRSAEIVAEACWAAGVPREVLRFVRTPDNAAGRAVVETADAVILTGSSETADVFRSWKPDLKLFAETSGKNVLIITPSADIDLAVEDLVASAFGHSGQKCSAASLAILVGDLAKSERFTRQLVDAVESLSVGPAQSPGTDIAPLVDGGNERLERAVDRLDPGESWLVVPKRTKAGQITPGVRSGVRPGSWFHQTECFGPILGLMSAATLDQAIEIANSSDLGLTGGIHSLDPAEIRNWADTIEIGNGYVNRAITGAIVQRQPFGGWKRSAVGPGAKAGGPNYLHQLGTWTPTSEPDDYAEQWASEFSVPHDDTGLFCEANVFRYRPLDIVGVAFGPLATADERAAVERIAEMAGVELRVAVDPVVDEKGKRVAWLRSLARIGVTRVRYVGLVPSTHEFAAAGHAGIHLITQAVTPSGRLEFSHIMREQAMSVTLHRFGNLVSADELRL